MINIINIIDEVSQQTHQLGLTKAVLEEVLKYFDSKDDHICLPYYAEQIQSLLFVINDYLYSTTHDLTQIVGSMQTKSESD